MTIEVLDPTYGEDPTGLQAAVRPESLKGLTIGIVSNGKQNTKPFFDSIETALREQHDVANVIRVTKGNYSAPASGEIMDEAMKWHALIAGVGD